MEEVVVKVSVETDNAIKNINKLGDELGGLKKQLEQEKSELSELKKEFKALSTPVDKLSKAQREYRQELIKSGKSLDSVSKELAQQQGKVKALSNNYNKLEKSALGVSKSTGRLSGAFKSGLIQFAALTGGVTALVSTIKTSITNFGLQEKAEKSLEVALGRTSQALLNQASALQSVTKFGDEAIIQGQAYLAQLGSSEKDIKRLTPAILDFAEAQGIDLNTAFQLVAKSVGTSTNALKRYGVDIGGVVGSQERLESAVNSLNTAFGGQASAAAEVGTGALKQFSNTVGDLQEKLGEIVVAGLNPLVKGLQSFVNDLSPAVSEQLQDQAVKSSLLASEIQSLEVGTEKRNKLLKQLISTYPEYNALIADESISNAELLKIQRRVNSEYRTRIQLQQVQEKLDVAESKRTERAEEFARTQEDIFRFFDAAGRQDLVTKAYGIDNLDERLKFLRKSAEDLKKTLPNYQDLVKETGISVVGASQLLGVGVRNLTKAEKDFLSLQETLDSRKNALGLGEGGKEQLKKEIGDTLIDIDDKIRTFKGSNTPAFNSLKEQLNQLKSDFAADVLTDDDLQELKEKANSVLDRANSTTRNVNTNTNNTTTTRRVTETVDKIDTLPVQQIEQEQEVKFEAMKVSEERITAMLKEQEDMRLSYRQAANDQWLDLTSGGLNAVSGLLSSFGKGNEELQRKLFNVNKGIQVAETIVSTYFAAQKAYASQLTIPSPDAPIRANVAAGIAIAQGLARVALITGTEPQGFAQGGYVYGAGTSTSDSIPAMLSNGEYIIPAPLVPTFAPMIEPFRTGQSPSASDAEKSADMTYRTIVANRNSQPLTAIVSEHQVTRAQSRVSAFERQSKLK